jgi:hypothetical protein
MKDNRQLLTTTTTSADECRWLVDRQGLVASVGVGSGNNHLS